MAYSGSQPVSEVVLSISCRDLLDKDFFSKSDPIVVVQESPDGVKWNEVSEKTADIVRSVRDWPLVLQVLVNVFPSSSVLIGTLIRLKIDGKTNLTA